MSVYKLRTLCNKRGLSCRDTNNANGQFKSGNWSILEFKSYYI